jgi:hypothetical protein
MSSSEIDPMSSWENNSFFEMMVKKNKEIQS